jgi:hypothetical protein
MPWSIPFDDPVDLSVGDKLIAPRDAATVPNSPF